MMKLKSMIFVFFYGALCFSQENMDIAQKSLRLSVKYTKGNILIYDCDDKHWVCTDKVEEKNCLDKREQVFLDNDQYYPCVVFKKFTDGELCMKEQQWLINQSMQVIYCTNPKFKY